jgi:VIT1/CCC1 family predicted Fe2+/Mn2+ transporter
VYRPRRDPDRPANTSPLLDKAVALVVSFAAMIVGGMVLLPLLIPLLGMLALMMIVVVIALVIVLGIVRAVMGSDREPVRQAVQRRRWR